MSAGAALREAAVATLRGDAALNALAVFDAPPTRALVPHAVIEEPVLQALDGAGVRGRVGVLGIEFRDAGEVPARLRVLMPAAERAIEAMAPALADGWRLAGLALTRSRLVRGKDGWIGRTEWAVRLFRAQ